MSRLIICLCFMLLTSGLSAQKSVDGFIELLGWVKKLDENISMIVRTENKKKLTRQLGYLQSDLDNFIDEKKDITNMIIQHCQDSSVSLSEIEKEIENYNTEVKILTSRIKEIRKTIIFKDDLYSVTEKRKITLYKISDEDNDDTIKAQSNFENAMIQQRVMDLQSMPQENRIRDKDTIIDVTITKNRNEWKEVDTENLFLEIEKSILTKGSNMKYILKELIKECNLELINNEHEMAIEVLTNIRNEFRDLRKKIRKYVPTK